MTEPRVLSDEAILEHINRLADLLHSLREARRERDEALRENADIRQELVDLHNAADVCATSVLRLEAERDAARAALRDLSKRWHNFAHGEEWPDWQKCPCCADVHYALGASS